METQSTQVHNFNESNRLHEHYRLLEHVNSGGFTDVWRAKGELVDTIVALILRYLGDNHLYNYCLIITKNRSNEKESII